MGPEQRSDAASSTYRPSLPQHPRMLNVTEKGKAGKIYLPRGLFRSLSSQTVHVVVTILNIPQLGMFQV